MNAPPGSDWEFRMSEDGAMEFRPPGDVAWSEARATVRLNVAEAIESSIAIEGSTRGCRAKMEGEGVSGNAGFSFNLPGDEHPYVRGRVLRFSTGVIGVPIEYKRDGWWRVVVIGGDHPTYPVGGTDVWASPRDIEESERIHVE